MWMQFVKCKEIQKCIAANWICISLSRHWTLLGQRLHFIHLWYFLAYCLECIDSQNTFGALNQIWNSTVPNKNNEHSLFFVFFFYHLVGVCLEVYNGSSENANKIRATSCRRNTHLSNADAEGNPFLFIHRYIKHLGHLNS